MLFLATHSFGSTILGLSEITPLQYILAWVFGIMTIPIYVLTNRFIADEKFIWFKNNIDLEQDEVVPDRIKKFQLRL